MIKVIPAIETQLTQNEFAQLLDIINTAYAETEKEVWGDNYMRIAKEDYQKHVDDGEVLIALHEGKIVGGIRHFKKTDEVYTFGLLGADFNRRGLGIGRALISRVEEIAKSAGAKKIEIEVLRAVGIEVESKEIVDQWYQRLGYDLTGTKDVLEIYNNPSKWAELANPSIFDSYLKNL